MKRNKILFGIVMGVMLGLTWSLGRAGEAAITLATIPSGLTVMVDGTNYTTPITFNWEIGSLHELAATTPQVSGDGHSRSIFTSWSDTGSLVHEIAVPGTAATYTASFSLQYFLDTTVSPSGAGTLSNNPAGPWYDAGQIVSLAAKTNASYRFYFWQGVDSAASNSAQVTMNSYRQVQASFIPSDYPYIIVTNSGGIAPGSLIGNLDGQTAEGTKQYFVVLDNTGTNALFASKTNILYRFVTPQGLDALAGSNAFVFKDETFNAVDTFTTLGYPVDYHDVKLLPNGHALVFGNEFRRIDLSQFITNGNPFPLVTGDVIQ